MRRWMGYGVFYDPTLPYLLAASALVVVGLLWMYLPLLKGAEIRERDSEKPPQVAPWGAADGQAIPGVGQEAAL